AIGYSQNPETNNTANWTVSKINNQNFLVSNPYDIEVGPDGWLWVTERASRNGNVDNGERLVRINPTTGVKTTMLDLTGEVFSSAGQDGLMGMAIHPALYANPATTVNNYVYLAYTYYDDTDQATRGVRRLRITRFAYDHASKTLLNNAPGRLVLIENIDASNDHNSGKLRLNPADMKLYYSIGDLGWNQFANKCKVIQSQALPSQADITNNNYYSYKGKMLRMNLDGSIPSDNPKFAPFIPTNTNPGPPDNSIADNLKVRSHIYSFGHRNAQGIVFAPDGTLYSSEHGDIVDDEFNIIQAGKNYGWPLVAGYYDNAGYDYCIKASAPGCSTANNDCPAGATVHQESAFPQPFDFVAPVATYNSTVAPNASTPSGGFLSWPTVAPSGIEYYQSLGTAASIPWSKSVLIPTLKKGTIYRYDLNAAGDAVVGNLVEFHSSIDRYRDVVVSADGTTIYAITDSTGSTSGPSGSSSLSLANPGAIIVIKYTPAAEPTNQPIGFVATGSVGKIALNWGDATGANPAGGYLIKA
ncbi:MAG: PQQ-dependent sugar dehydrogenase, partial [Nonlabens sp.]|nr:PQQ-dependent sugar dehydrogenase [Nonlabens sp.]